MRWIKASERLPGKLPKSDYSEYVYVTIGNGEDGWEMKRVDRYDHVGRYWDITHHPPLYVISWLDESMEIYASESGAGMKEALSDEGKIDLVSNLASDYESRDFSQTNPQGYEAFKKEWDAFMINLYDNHIGKALSSQQEQEPDLSALEKLDDRERKSVLKYFKFLNKGI